VKLRSDMFRRFGEGKRVTPRFYYDFAYVERRLAQKRADELRGQGYEARITRDHRDRQTEYTVWKGPRRSGR
jgi:mannose/cellobiose epimerase-like protein (N-acyl-D-glucosamine 2-epimerase family)